MTSNLELKLRLAQPHLIASIEFMEPEPRTARIRPYTRQSDPGWDELVDEGYDPNGPMGPTYLRIVRRGRERFTSAQLSSGGMRWSKAGDLRVFPIAIRKRELLR
jgi:hypothetical protein